MFRRVLLLPSCCERDWCENGKEGMNLDEREFYTCIHMKECNPYWMVLRGGYFSINPTSCRCSSVYLCSILCVGMLFYSNL